LRLWTPTVAPRAHGHFPEMTAAQGVPYYNLPIAHGNLAQKGLGAPLAPRDFGFLERRWQ
jgi:hypothetical protein